MYIFDIYFSKYIELWKETNKFIEYIILQYY